MKKLIVLVATAAGVAWAVARSQSPTPKAAPPSDAWAAASDRV